MVLIGAHHPLRAILFSSTTLLPDQIYYVRERPNELLHHYFGLLQPNASMYARNEIWSEKLLNIAGLGCII